MKKGALTVYFSLLLVLLLSLLFTILESSRASCLRGDAMRMSEAAAESMFAEYSRPLLEEYDLLMLDFGYGKEGASKEQVEKRMESYLYQNASNSQKLLGMRMDMLGLTLQAAELEDYRLATDRKGEAFYEEACEYMQEELLLNVGKDLFSFLSAQSASEDSTSSTSEAWEEVEAAQAALDDPSSYGEEASEEFTAEEISKAGQVTEEEKGLLSRVAEMKSKGVLSLLVENPSELSDAVLNSGSLLTERSLEEGTAESSEKCKGSRILFQCYIADKFTDFRSKETEGHALQYEKEYIYAGKKTDLENLEVVATRILALREAANLASLLSDPQKVEEARILAIAIAGVMALPAIFSVIEGGVLMAWAFMDSVSDLQKLFAGDKVSALEMSGKGYGELDYEQYLQILLLGRSKESLVERSMTLIEENIRLKEGYEGFCFDHCLTEAKWKVDWEASPLFLSLFPVNGYSSGFYTFSAEGAFSYSSQ
jgi:hypothetical protein